MDDNINHYQGVGENLQHNSHFSSSSVPQERLLQQPELGRLATEHSNVRTQDLQRDEGHPYGWRGRVARGAGVEFY